LGKLTTLITLALLSAGLMSAQPFGRGGGPGQQLLRQGKLEEALALAKVDLEKTPDSASANNLAGTALDLLGRGAEAKRYFAKAIESAASPQAKAMAQRAMAMSYAFDGDCANTVKYEQMVFDYYVSMGDGYQQGEMADEAARVCIDHGDLNTAEHWYRIGYESGLKQKDIPPDRVSLWNFRWEHAQARLAARRGNQAEAQKHIAAAKAALDKDPRMAEAQSQFYPYLTGYVAFYLGNYKTALEDLKNASQNDPFIQCLMGETYEKLGEKDKAMECYRKAATTTAHNPPAAFARPFATKKL
jgi:tetratricopeptide (TPR) repeat protein